MVSFSSSWRAVRGVRQVGVTTAYLYCIYLDDILERVCTQLYAYWLGIRKINIQDYADDICVFCPTASGLKRLLTKLETKLKQYQIIVNVTETKAVIFSEKKRHSLIPIFKMNGVNLYIVNE